ncbi:hypothetical protein M5K25_020088 [Dendrobium thyrsiflorum]|uniref:TOD1/MUCI70 glycosyltransferase-like domain-containing protein n=1 Tax=Dendrobium thyrsiflorum TaxID=117978 RepID=A0ABD0U915_DENTH
MEVEVVYMVGHGDEPHQTRGYKRRNEPGPASSKTTTSQEDQIQYEQLEGEEVPSGDEQNDDQEEEVLAETLAQAQRRLKFQMKEKDKEISELNSKMTEMMAQMTAMMQLMQKNIITNPALVQPADHQSSIPINLPTNPVPQELLDRVAKFEKLNLSKSEYHSDRPRRNKTVDTRRDEESVKVITSSPILPINEEDKIKGKMMPGKDEWQTVISKKTMKMIKQLEGVPGIKWKSSTEPVLELKENPNSGASTSRSLTWRRFKTKRFYKTSSKKFGSSNKHSKLKEKRTVLQKIINNLEDYRQPVRRPITLADFMSELQIDPSEVEEDEQDDEELLHVETCRVISVTSTVCQRDSIKDHDRGQIVISPIKMTNKMTSESCLMVLQTDDNSEEELCFPSDDESDQRIVSQMERVKLNEDSEHTTKTSLDEAESNEVDQVQLRSDGPCEVSFTKSVEHLVQPENYMNFTKFSLDYVLQEQQHYSNNSMLQPKFGGHQTLEERENSYYARNETLHCGFVKGPEGYPSTGFDVNEKDKEYMARCRVAVSSCIFGSSDFLRRPTSKLIGTYSKKNVCFLMFLDELTMRKLSLEGHVPDDEGYIGLWKIVLVKKLPYTDMRKTGKVPKFLSHRLFPSAWYSIWIDSKMRLQTDPMLILEYFLWRKKSEYAISNHYDRHCVWEEVVQNKRLNKYNHSAIDEQFQFYQYDGLVKFNESDSSAPLPSYVPEGSFIVRAHTPMSNLFSCLWFNEVDRFTSRDQLSFAYAFLKLRRMNPGKPFFLNMFKDCERRAMAKIFHHRVENTSSPGWRRE